MWWTKQAIFNTPIDVYNSIVNIYPNVDMKDLELTIQITKILFSVAIYHT